MKYKIAFFGTPDFALSSLQALLDHTDIEVPVVVTQPDKAVGRGQKVKFSPIKELALKHTIPVLQPTSVKKELTTFLEQLNKFGPLDACVITAFGQILPIEVLDLPKAGSINVHASLLPRWRGAAPIQRSIMEGDSHTGVCLMKMEAGLDTGPVYVESKHVEIRSETTAGILHDKLAQLGGELIHSKIVDIVTGEIQSIEQDDSKKTYAHKILKKDLKINWQKSAKEIHRQIMGLSPYPGAKTSLNGMDLKILETSYSTSPMNDEKITENSAEVGSITALSEQGIEVATLDGTLRILKLQKSGKKSVCAGDFLRGYSLEVGNNFE